MSDQEQGDLDWFVVGDRIMAAKAEMYLNGATPERAVEKLHGKWGKYCKPVQELLEELNRNGTPWFSGLEESYLRSLDPTLKKAVDLIIYRERDPRWGFEVKQQQ